MKKGWQKALWLVGLIIIIYVGIYYFYPAVKDVLSPPKKGINVILISVDALRADRVSFYGYPAKLTPNIDRLAESGVVFRRTYCYGGNTAASMGAIFTSRFPYWPLDVPGGGPRWHVKHHYGFSRFQDNSDLRPGIPDTLETLPTIFKKHDYTTVGISTNPYLTKDFNFHRGFDFFEEFSSQWRQLYPGVETVVAKLDTYLSELHDTRFFAWLHLMDLHHPLRDFGPFLEEAQSRRNQAAPKYPPVSEWTEEAVKILTEFGSRAIPDWKPGEEGLRKALEEYILAYEAELVRIDRQIGVLIEKLRLHGLWDNTLVVLVTDHGEEFADHRIWDHRGQLYEAIVRGVWIMHNPRLFPGPKVVEERVNLIDLLPTLINLLGIKEGELTFDGKSRISLLKKESKGEDGLVFGMLDRRAYIIDGDFKLMVNGDYGKKNRGAHPDPPYVPIELYNIKNDPEELRNLVDESPEMVDRLMIRLKRAFLEKGIHLWESSPSKEISKEVKERLKSLGYIK
ncbi:MAG: sulfatase-like hydrolase/transferase [Candidatus Aminicenantes bacterium]|nr:MAG: sulfatase-like hydrolase/transferase [Candidatus Aminicenantes bacterium]